MEVSRQQSILSPRDDSNKENICPLLDLALSGDFGWRRSPLPQGFPRSPLQDITHVVSPLNIWPDAEGPLTSQACKKIKKVKSAEIFSVDEAERGSSWKGLNHCLHLKLSGREVVIVEAVMRARENDEVTEQGQTAFCSGENLYTEATIDLHIGRVHEQVDGALVVLDCDGVCLQACGIGSQGMEEGVRGVEGFPCKVEMKERGEEAAQEDSKQKFKSIKPTLVQVKYKSPPKPWGSKCRSTSNILKFR